MIEVDGKELPWSENLTIAALLKKLDDIKFCSVVRLNGKLVSSPKFETTQIQNRSKIQILPLVAGG
jgi:thiamine biosynthesis protein ThiS